MRKHNRQDSKKRVYGITNVKSESQGFSTIQNGKGRWDTNGRGDNRRKQGSEPLYCEVANSSSFMSVTEICKLVMDQIAIDLPSHPY